MLSGQVEQKGEEGGRGRQKSSGQRLYVSQRKERKVRDAYLEAKTGHQRNPSERAGGIMNEAVEAYREEIKTPVRLPSGATSSKCLLDFAEY